MSPFDKAKIDDLRDLAGNFGAVRIAVVGDLILDRFLYGEVERISPEAPVPVVQVEEEVYRLGGAANVVRNLCSLGAKATLYAVVGEDARAERVRELLAEAGGADAGLVTVDDRPTALKTRVFARHQQVVRFDREKVGELSRSVSEQILAGLEERMGETDAIIVSDYAKGVVGDFLMEGLVELARQKSVLVTVDPKPANTLCYKGVDVIKPNVKEIEEMTNTRARSDEEAGAAARALMELCGVESVLMTRGERGMTLVGKENVAVPTFAKDVFDVTGAGDTAISTFTLACAAGGDMATAARLANLASGIVVGKVGTATVTADELLGAVSDGITGRAGSL